MNSIASVHICTLPLQLLLHRHPDWREQPVAVVDQDRAQGMLLWVNEAARRSGILPGMRYATGLSLERNLCAGTVAETDLLRAERRLFRLLHRFAPRVERVASDPGQFFLDLRGLDWSRMQPEGWAQETAKAIFEEGFLAKVVLGFDRFAVDIEGRQGWGTHCFPSPEAELQALRRTPIDRLPLPAAVRDRLLKLGICDTGAFLDLPSDGIRRRFGREVWELQQRACHQNQQVDAHAPPRAPLDCRIDFDVGESDRARLLKHLETMLDQLMTRLGAEQQSLAALHLRMDLEDHTRLKTTLSPATPSLNRKDMAKLLALRLEQLDFPAAVAGIHMRVRGVRASTRQFSFWEQRSGRSPEQARQAFAELRAEFGNQVVQVARLQDAHLPEAQFRWEAMERLPRPTPLPGSPNRLLRQLLLRPKPIHPPFPANRPPPGVLGPHILSGGWWNGQRTRAYFYEPTPHKTWRWVFFDLQRQEWFEQGCIR